MLLVAFMICLSAVPSSAEPHWQYVRAEGLNMMIAPADEMGRVRRFIDNNGPLIQGGIVDKGGLQIIDKMSKTACAGWWAIAIYIPPGQRADFKKGEAKIIMAGVHKRDTVTVESEQILFAYGWGLQGQALPLNQRNPRSTKETTIQVRCSEDPSLNDLEWMIKDDVHYVIGWVSFPWEKVKNLKPYEFRLGGVSVN